jgi:ankyrin repeat protein
MHSTRRCHAVSVAILAFAAAAMASSGAHAGESSLTVIDAVKEGDPDAVLAALRSDRVAVNRASRDGTTPLHWAARRGDVAMVNLLLHHGGNARAVNRFGITPLWLACVDGSVPIVDALLKAGADVNAPRLDSGETPLMITARSGHAVVVDALVHHGADVNAVEHVRGQTALMWAASERHPAVVRVLLDAGADPRKWSKTMSALMFAVRAGDVESTRLLLEAGVDVNEPAPDGTRALVVAILNARFDVGILLLQKGADPNATDPHNSPLHVLAFLRRAHNYGLSGVLPRQMPTTGPDTIDMAKALLAAGANINARYDTSARTGPKYGLNGLPALETPADLALGNYTQGRVSFAGATPFFVATISGDAPFMRFLAANGADPNLRTFQNVTPLLAASGVAWFEHPATAEEALDAVKLAHDLGNDLEARIDYGDAKVRDASWQGADALHGAINIGAVPLVKWLIDNGAPLNTKTKQGLTPLQRALARRGGGTELVALLREGAAKRGVALDEETTSTTR